MLTTLEILELARKGLRDSIHSKKRVLYMCKHNGKPAQDVEKELEELKAKYKELEKMIISEKDKMY